MVLLMLIDEVKRILLNLIMSTHFLHKNKRYRQIDEVAVRSPLGPIFTNMFLA